MKVLAALDIQLTIAPKQLKGTLIPLMFSPGSNDNCRFVVKFDRVSSNYLSTPSLQEYGYHFQMKRQPMSVQLPLNSTNTHSSQNRLRLEDQAVHDWYRFVQSFPPHLVRTYIDRFSIDSTHTVLDPFCGAGTTLVECKKLGISSKGLEAHPMPHFASSVKSDWSADSEEILKYASEVVESSSQIIQGTKNPANKFKAVPESASCTQLELLNVEQSKLLIKNSISPLPMHKTLILLRKIDEHYNWKLRKYGRLALARALVDGVSNLKFGPEVGLGRIKKDAPVLEIWLRIMQGIAKDMSTVSDRALVPCHVYRADAREVGQVLEPQSIDAVITSPPYPNEKDYTRTTRLESVILDLVKDRKDLRQVKRDLLRSNTRGVYKTDTDDQEVAQYQTIRTIAETIENRRIELGKTSGFERLYARVTLLYFGGMLRHLASLRTALRPGAQLAYVLGDQASYLRVMIPTGQIIADIAQSLGYQVQSIDLFRTRFSTVTRHNLREEVVVLKWPEDQKPER